MVKQRVNLTIDPKVLEIGEVAAGKMRRSLSGYVEELILADSKPPKKMSEGGVWPAVKLSKKRVKK